MIEDKTERKLRLVLNSLSRGMPLLFKEMKDHPIIMHEGKVHYIAFTSPEFKIAELDMPINTFLKWINDLDEYAVFGLASFLTMDKMNDDKRKRRGNSIDVVDRIMTTEPMKLFNEKPVEEECIVPADLPGGD